MKRQPRYVVPFPAAHPRALVRLWPRTPRINRHIAERALRVAAFGSDVCRPFPVNQTP